MRNYFLAIATTISCCCYAGNNPRQSLSSAIEAGDLGLVQKYINNGEVGIDDLSDDDLFGVSPIIEAAKAGRISLFPYLLEKGAHVDGFSMMDTTALVELLKKSNKISRMELLKGVTLLLDHDAQVDKLVLGHYTALMVACQYARFPELIELLIERGANVNRVSKDGNSPFTLALTHKNTQALAILHKKGVDFTQLTPSGNTPLGLLASKGDVWMAKHFEQYVPLEVNQRDAASLTPAMWAVINDHLEFLQFLTNRGADLTLATLNETQLDHRTASNISLKVLIFPKGSTVYTFSHHFDHHAITRWLLRKGVPKTEDLKVVTRQKKSFNE